MGLAVVAVQYWVEGHLLAAGRVVPLRASDGRTVNGLLTEARERTAPSVVLVPMLGRPKEDWNALADRFADAGVTALAIDLPAGALSGSGFADVTAAVMYLVTRQDGLATSIGVLGASAGANVAAMAAAGNSYVRSVALVSPSLDYQGIRIEGPFRQYGSRPALLVSSLGDPYSSRSVKSLVGDTPTHEVQWSDAAAHGTMLLSADPSLQTRLVEWFQRTLGAN